jgi:hypothetical protein
VCLSFGAKKGIEERRWRERVGGWGNMCGWESGIYSGRRHGRMDGAGPTVRARRPNERRVCPCPALTLSFSRGAGAKPRLTHARNGVRGGRKMQSPPSTGERSGWAGRSPPLPPGSSPPLLLDAGETKRNLHCSRGFDVARN